ELVEVRCIETSVIALQGTEDIRGTEAGHLNLFDVHIQFVLWEIRAELGDGILDLRPGVQGRQKLVLDIVDFGPVLPFLALQLHFKTGTGTKTRDTGRGEIDDLRIRKALGHPKELLNGAPYREGVGFPVFPIL